jgi:hypothetical protein
MACASPRRLLALAVTTVVAAAVTAAPAATKDGDVLAQGTCTRASTVKLKLSDEDGRIEAELEVDQNRNGVPWRVTLRRNGRVVARTTARTRPPSGSFEVRRVLAGGGGVRVAGVATSPSGERCSVAATF